MMKTTYLLIFALAMFQSLGYAREISLSEAALSGYLGYEYYEPQESAHQINCFNEGSQPVMHCIGD